VPHGTPNLGSRFLFLQPSADPLVYQVVVRQSSKSVLREYMAKTAFARIAIIGAAALALR
jgi:hypothetical protein